MPLINKQKHSHGIIALWHITEQPEQLQAMLTIDEFLPFKSDRRNRHWLAARIALQEAVGISNSRIIKNHHGKPFLSDEDGHISMTHSGNLAAAIYNSKANCGIDLELFDERINRIAHKFCTEEEKLLIPIDFYNGSLCLIWSAKEAVFKYANLHDIDFKIHIKLLSLDFENQMLEFCFCRVNPNITLKVYFRVFEQQGDKLIETSMLDNSKISNTECYILTWI